MPLTREQWDAKCTALISDLMRGGFASERAIRGANAAMLENYGPRPESPRVIQADVPSAPWWLRLGASAALAAARRNKTMSGLLKTLDGWKLIIGVAVLFAVNVFDAISGGHFSNIATSVLSVLGWMPGPQSGFTFEGIVTASASAVALWGFIMKLVKARQQMAAGAKISETLSPVGVVKLAVVDGTLKIMTPLGDPVAPVLLKVEEVKIPSAEATKPEPVKK